MTSASERRIDAFTRATAGRGLAEMSAEQMVWELGRGERQTHRPPLAGRALSASHSIP